MMAGRLIAVGPVLPVIVDWTGNPVLNEGVRY